MTRYRFLRFPGGKTKAATFSYDDGVKSDVRLATTLSAYGLKGTFNLNSFSMRGDSGISKDDVKAYILDKGHEVAIHGFYHRAEGTLRAIEGIREVVDNRIELENLFGIIIRGMAYPDSGITRFTNDATYSAIKNYLTELDICYSRTLGGDNNGFNLPADWHAWMPTAHHKNPNLLKWIDEFKAIDFSKNTYGAHRLPKLLYIWGHSYEFNNDNNWDLFEEICRKIADSDDTWYATNMEIYEYVKAYNSLEFSADGRIIKNPTLFTIWLDNDGVIHSIKPGEVITL